MKLSDLTLVLILAYHSDGQDWDIRVPSQVTAALGSNVIIECTFTSPGNHTADVQVYWKKLVKASFKTSDRDKNAFVFHPNASFVTEKYRGKTRLIGDKSKGNCSLLIERIQSSERWLYVRLLAKDEYYSFFKNTVSIQVSGVEPFAPPNGTTPPPLIFTSPHVNNALETSELYAAIITPLSVLVLIILVTSVFCLVKRKRSQSFTREESGYYANCSRSATKPVQSGVPHQIIENQKLSELKNIDEPIYVNTQELKEPSEDKMDHTQNVYGNL